MSEPRIRVLCIDDEARILRALKALFRDMDVHTTTEPSEAIRWAASAMLRRLRPRWKPDSATTRT